MSALLDTHLLLWLALEPERLDAFTRTLVTDGTTKVYFSPVSVLEVTIKAARKRPDFEVVPSVFRRALDEGAYIELELNSRHAIEVGHLPDIHRDPFDRLLIAQARVEGLPLLTVDRVLARYGDPVVIVG